MKIQVTLLAIILMLLALSQAALAMDHAKMEHDKVGHSKMDHDGMKMKGEMIKLPGTEADGIEASARMKDISKPMAQMGMDKTHHFMVKFVDLKTGEAIEKGSVALRVVDGDGNKSKPVRLMSMDGQFGADITIGEGMMHTLEVGTKLTDGKKRQFEFMFHQM